MLSFQMSFDIQDCLLQTTCKRKHLILDKDYNCYVFPRLLVIAENLSKPKYILHFTFENRLLWKFNQEGDILKAIGIPYQNKIKWFESDNEKLLLIKSTLGNVIFFGNISLFYDSMNVIGSGASSKLSEDRTKDNSQQSVYLKNISPKGNLMNDQYQKLRLYQEITILQKIDHKNFVKLLEIYQGENSYYLITDLYAGDTLYRYIKSNPDLDEAQTKIIMKQILSALCNLEQNQIVHRDIKLENIMLESANDVHSIKIIDFGLAIDIDRQSKFTVCGTPGYIAPEILQVDDDKSEKKTQPTYSFKSDIFSAGVIFYKLLTRRTLFRGAKTVDILDQNKVCQIDFSELQFNQSISDEAIGLLKSMLSVQKSQRPLASEALGHQFFASQVTPQKTQSIVCFNQISQKNTNIMQQQVGKYQFKTKEKELEISHDSISTPKEDHIQKMPVFRNFFKQKQWVRQKLQKLKLNLSKNESLDDNNTPMKQRNHFSSHTKRQELQSPYIPSFSIGNSLESFKSPITSKQQFGENPGNQQQQIEISFRFNN